MLSPVRRILKRIHPEGLPFVGTLLYNLFSQTSGFQRQYELVARDILEFCQAGSILDVGTGPGWLLTKLHRLSPGLELTGADISPSMVNKAQKNMERSGLADEIPIIESGVTDLAFDDGRFEAVVSTGSIHHWKDPEAGLNEIFRVLKPGGFALIYDLVSDTPSHVKKETARRFGRLRMLLLWLHAYEEPFYSLEDFERICRPTLFKEGRLEFVGVFCRLVMRKPETKTAAGPSH